jgi:copper resistance protein D
MLDLFLAAARAIHYGALAQFAGLFVFLRVVLGAVPCPSSSVDSAALRRRFSRLAWTSLVIITLSGAAWLVLEGVAITDEPLSAVFRSGVIGALLDETRFGRDWEIRAALAALAALLLALPGRDGAGRQVALLFLGAGMLGGVAWVGHAAARAGEAGDIHIVADTLHLLAVGCWMGGLLPLALTFVAAGRANYATWAPCVSSVTRRFSTLGLWSVGTLLATGLVNAWFLIDGPAALVETSYGRWLLVKIILFLVTVAIAGVNRFRLTPRLEQGQESVVAMRGLRRNALTELALSYAIFVVIGVLGLLPPAIGT